MNVELHAQRRGWLKNGNPPGDFRTAARWCEDPAEDSVSGASDAEWPLQDARGREHRAADPGGT